MQSMEGQYDSTSETLFDATIKLEAKEKAYSTAAGEAASLNRRLWLLEEEVSKSEEKMAKAVYTLTKESKRADQGTQLNIILFPECWLFGLKNGLRFHFDSEYVKSTHF